MTTLSGKPIRQIPNKNRKTYTLTALAVQTDYDIATDMGVRANNLTFRFDQDATIYIYDGENWDDGHPHDANIETIIKDEEIIKFRVVPAASGNGSIQCSGG